MPSVRVFPNGRITLPKVVRESMGIEVGDTLILEKAEGKVLLKKGKTLFDYVGALPSLGLSIEEMRERAVEKAARDRCQSPHRRNCLAPASLGE